VYESGFLKKGYGYFCSMQLGSEIKKARQQKGLTQAELAEHSRLTERTIQRIENHEVEPSVYSLGKLSVILEVDFQNMKDSIQKRQNYWLYGFVIVYSAAMIFRVFSSTTDWPTWWEFIIWVSVIVGILSKQIYIPYYRKDRKNK